MRLSKPCKIIIVGRDAAVWLSANALSSAFGLSGVSVEVIELPSKIHSVDVFAALPALEPFHRLIGLEESEVLSETAGAYSLGQSFNNFSGPSTKFFHPYGSHGTALGQTPFFQYWLKARQNGLKASLDDFSLNAIAAKKGKFFKPDLEVSQFGNANYGYHLHALSYVNMLRKLALKKSLVLHSARHISVKLDPLTGDICSILLNTGEEVFGNIFIDCTGPESELLEGALAEPFQPWTDLFCLNRTLTTKATPFSSIPAYAEVRAQSTGILTVLPLQGMTGVQFAFHDALMKDDEALCAISALLDINPTVDAVVDKTQPGHRNSVWRRNCVAIGAAACTFDHIDSVNLQMVQQGLVHLISLFPLDEDMALERNEYNEIMHNACMRVRDFQIVHYRFNELDKPLWHALKHVSVPESLAAKIDAFLARGLVISFDHETFENDSWLSIFTGHGLTPATYDPVLDLIPDDDAIRQFIDMRTFIGDQVSNMSSHDAYLELYAAKESSCWEGRTK